MELKAFADFCGEKGIKYKLNEPMCAHTSFKIGGPADIFAEPKNKTELVALLEKASELNIKIFILGKGSNLLISDSGIEGAVLSLSGMNGIEVAGSELTAIAGTALSEVCRAAAENGLSGLEFAYGIPGSAGGALFMNAGAYGGEMADTVKSAEFADLHGKTGRIERADMQLGYRTSIFKSSDMVVTSVTFALEKGDKADIEAAMNDYIGRRKAKQPLEYPSAGSTFKRPDGYFAGALIERNGLKGTSVGGAMVSEKHAGFVINYNNASCKDVKKLIEKIKQTVKAADGVDLEPEVIFAGRE